MKPRCVDRRWGILVLTAVLACSGGAAQERPRSGEPQEKGTRRAWVERFDYELEIDGVPSGQGRFFSTRGRPSMLLMAPEIREVLILQLSGREVLIADRQAVEESPDPEQINLDDAAIHGPAEPYALTGDVVVLYHEGRRIQVSRKSPLVGETSIDGIFEHSPIYRVGMERYTPSPEDVAYLQACDIPVTVQVFFGSWCPACKQTVPRFLKSIDAAANPKFSLSFTGVPTPPFAEYPPVREKNIRSIPTFIVSIDGEEIGRIGAIPGGSSVEHELVRILTAYRQGRG